jgi:hypothetical protein
MNIRSLSNPAQVLAKEKIEASKSIKSDETNEREANGQQTHSEGDSYRPLSEKEIQDVIDKLKKHPGVINHALEINHKFENNQNVILIQSPEGQTIRRFAERDLYFLWEQSTQDDIQLIKKTA